MSTSQREAELNRLKRTYIKLSNEWYEMNKQINSNTIHTSQIREKLVSVGKVDEIIKINNMLKEKRENKK